MHEIYHNIAISTNKTALFDAVTLPEHIDNWWTKKCSGSPVTGAEYMFWFAPEFDWRAKLTLCSKPDHVIYNFIKADDDWVLTKLEFLIETIDDRNCRLYFYHKNWKNANPHFGRTSYCWAMYLNGLKKYLEQQLILPYENRGGG